jgi:nucleoside phosphorylase/CheY-like chemotaxis protein
MRVLIIEDQREKYSLIEAEIRNFFHDIAVIIVQADSLSLANKYVFESKYDLIIIDLMMPLRSGDAPEDISEEIISTIELSECNKGANIIALSGFEELVVQQRDRFSEASIVLVRFDTEDSSWKKHISIALSRIRQQLLFDFVVVCALDKERNAFRSTKAEASELRNIRGLDCLPLDISGLRGVCIKQPRMGLVEASVIASRAINRFSPKIVAMSGICAGVATEAAIGTLVIADPCWEYQCGKWSNDGFKIEHYDVCLEVNARTILSQLIGRLGKGADYKKDLLEDPVVFQSIKIAPMATGSAVIADSDRVAMIREQHRKIAAIDMEMYGVYKAAQLSAINPIVFGAKTVVDLADSTKGDQYHEYGAILSARFVLDAIVDLHKHLVTK